MKNEKELLSLKEILHLKMINDEIIKYVIENKKKIILLYDGLDELP